VTASMTLIDAALAIAATNIPVFPCGADKSPVCAGGFKAATKEPGRIRSLFAHSAAAMIGIPTGEISGVVAVDIDPRHDGNIWLDEHRAQLPATRTHRTLQGGLHLLFKDGGHAIRNSAGVVNKTTGRKSGIAEGVDIRGNGGYIIMPPSPGYSVLDDAPIADMPPELIALCRKPTAGPEAAKAVPPIQRRPWDKPVPRDTDSSAYGRAALDGACDDLRHVIDGGKHHAINKAGFSVGGLVSAGEVAEADAWRAINDALAEILPRCDDKRAAQATLARSFKEGKGRPRDVPERQVQPEAGAHDPITAPFLATLAPFNEALQRASTAKPLPVKDNLMAVEGALKLFVDYCQDMAISPQPFLALAAAITAVGVLAGRKYRTKTNLRTNIYAIGVADSGGGKDHARGRIKDVFGAAGLTTFMGGEDIASGTAIMTALGRHPAMLFQIDEFGDWLGDVLGPKSAPHRKQIAQRLKTLYSSAGSFISGTEYADQSKLGRPREDIQQPHACLYGTTTPGQFWKAIATGSLEDGLLARFLIFVSPESYPDRRRPTVFDPPAKLVEAFKAIADGPAITGGGNLAGLMVAATAPEPVLVGMTDDAEAAYDAFDTHVLERQRKHAGTYVTAIAGRMVENATKLALVRAVSRDPYYPVITGPDMAWGRALAEHCVDTLLREAGDNVAETPYQKNIQQAKKVIRAIGPCTKRDMQRKGWRLPEREADEILRMLVGTEEIIETMKEGGTGKGRPTVRYSIGAT
jgi:hypothetical protein